MAATDTQDDRTRQDGSGPRGRRADSPGEIPVKGWKDIVWRVYGEISDDRVMLIAAGVTFYLLLAIGPLLAAFVSIYGLFLDRGEIATQAEALVGIVPGGGVDILTGQLERLADTDQGTLGFAFVLSLAIALWSANAGMKALFQAMNVAYDEIEERGFVTLNLVTLCFTVLTIAGVIGLIVLNTFFGSLLSGTMMTVVTAVVALMALILFMACLYRYGASRDEPEWAWLTPGAIFAGIMIVVVSALFSFYVANFGSYNETYGSLGAVVGFLTWLWLAIMVLIMGAEINAEMEHQTRHDTTDGAPEPMGQRDATVADSLGETYGGKS